jgi:hypothetical protein
MLQGIRLTTRILVLVIVLFDTGEDTVFVLSVGHIFQAPELQPYMRGEP